MSARPQSSLRWLVLSAALLSAVVTTLALWWPSEAVDEAVMPPGVVPDERQVPRVTAPSQTPHAIDKPSPEQVATVGPPIGSALPPPGVPSSAPGEPQKQPWTPPTPDEPVFDLNADGRVGRDERERADEILAFANEFASNRSPDGTFPILKESFRGEPRLFRAMDADGDGALSSREWTFFHVDSIREVRRFDQNADGAATLAEMGVAMTRFDYLDFDHDGFIWAWEIDIQRGRGKW
jgi:hypothetical protein